MVPLITGADIVSTSLVPTNTSKFLLFQSIISDKTLLVPSYLIGNISFLCYFYRKLYKIENNFDGLILLLSIF